MIRELLSRVAEGQDLSKDEARMAMEWMMDGKMTPVQTASLLTALRMKGETVDELSGFAAALRERATAVPLDDPEAVDTCGTGGDGGRTFNISTASAIVASAAGVTVAKHGNRAVSGKSGSADVLEALGVEIALPVGTAHQVIRRTGIGFLFAPLFHRAMKQVGPVRAELGFRTCFNLMGPLANPARVTRQLVGVYDPELTGKVARVLRELGSKRAMVVSGLDGLDEITVTGPTRVSELKDGRVITYEVTPEGAGLSRWPLGEIRADGPETSARMIREVLSGKRGAPRDAVLLNAGAVLCVAGKASSLKEGVRIAAETVDSGKARRRLEEWIRASQEVRHVS
jgi:anthranilate phosphoribosyltransferase